MDQIHKLQCNCRLCVHTSIYYTCPCRACIIPPINIEKPDWISWGEFNLIRLQKFADDDEYYSGMKAWLKEEEKLRLSAKPE